MDLARNLVQEEANKEDQQTPYYNFCLASQNVDSSSTFFPGTKTYDLTSSHSKAEQIEAMRFEFELTKRHMERELSRCEKQEKGLKVLFGGYFKREE